jgi:hypothetical protein
MAFIHLPRPGQPPDETIDAGSGFDLQDLHFPAIEYYGWDHAQQVSTLAKFIAETQFDVKGDDLQAVYLAGMLHDLGRTTPWQQADPHHNKRSAELAVAYMRGAGKFQVKSELIEPVERLILLHDLSAKDLPHDPLLRALWDADSYDAARIMPGSVEGLKLFKARTQADRLCTQWAKERVNKQKWLKHRGWR